MIRLYKKISSNCSLKYRTRSGSIDAYKEGSYHVIDIDGGNPLVRQLKAIHGFVERKETETYNAIKDVKKESQRVQRSIIESAKKVEVISKDDSDDKKSISKKKKSTTKNYLSNDNTDI